MVQVFKVKSGEQFVVDGEVYTKIRGKNKFGLAKDKNGKTISFPTRKNVDLYKEPPKQKTKRADPKKVQPQNVNVEEEILQQKEEKSPVEEMFDGGQED